MPNASQPSADAQEPRRTTKESVKETLTSILIAFVLAFVFRGFVVEAFVIPTGSMAPTLMGAHIRVRGNETGYAWAVGPRDHAEHPGGTPMPIQGTLDNPIVVNDPMTGQPVISGAAGLPLRAGDRILVLKYLYALYPPARFDVVVFKNPTNPQENYIKRLVGLEREQFALVDGDIFTRPVTPGTQRATGRGDAWSEPGWSIARKPIGVQRAVWQPVFDSRFAPVAGAGGAAAPSFVSPWAADGRGWKVEGDVYSYEGAGPTELVWDASRPRYREGALLERWAIDDRYPYNQTPRQHVRSGPWTQRFLVSDVRVRAGVEPASEGLGLTIMIETRGHEFVAQLEGDRATIRQRVGAGAGSLTWTELASAPLTPLEPGAVTNVEFWHVDQSLQIWVNDELVCEAVYDWDPATRIQYAMGRSIADLLSEEARTGMSNIFADPAQYGGVEVKWGFSGGAFRMHRVGLDRDLYYRAEVMRETRGPARSTHPSYPLTLEADEFFALGDNSPASQDGRLLGDPNPWVAKDMWSDRGLEPKGGVVPKDLLLGKAFFVYFPGMHPANPLPVPDFGRMRFIR